MKLRATITIDVDAADYVDAADHQRSIEAQVEQLRLVYPGASLVLRERRAPSPKAISVRPPEGSWPGVRQSTGRLSRYVD